mgnify:CR=1 FL=1
MSNDFIARHIFVHKCVEGSSTGHSKWDQNISITISFPNLRPQSLLMLFTSGGRISASLSNMDVTVSAIYRDLIRLRNKLFVV